MKWIDWRELGEKQKRQVYRQYQQTARKRIKRLEERGYALPVETQDYFERIKVSAFPPQTSFKTEAELNSGLAELEAFLTKEKSTLSGIKAIMKRVKVGLERKLNEFRSDRFKIRVGERQLYNFLHSSAFRQLKKLIDSDILVEDFNDMHESLEYDEIMTAFNSFLGKELNYSDYKSELEKAKSYGS